MLALYIPARADTSLLATHPVARLQAVWEGVMGYAKAPNVHPASFAAALPVLATLARRRLVQVPPGFHKLWGLPLLQQIPSPAGLDFLTAAALSGRDVAIDGSAWQPAFLQWLRAAPGAAAPAGLAAAIAAVLRLPELPGCKIDAGTGRRRDNSSGSNASPSLSRMPAEGEGWWHWWHDDSTLAAQLAGLIRGEAQNFNTTGLRCAAICPGAKC
jgi:hypothetical protein